MGILRMELVDYQGQHALVTVHYFSGFLSYDIHSKVLNNIFGNFGLAQKINSHNGPCFRTGKFRSFCNQLEIVKITSSPYYNQRVVGTIEHILKKSTGNTDITKALTKLLHTLVSDTLPSPAELFFNRRNNTSLSMIMTPVPLTYQHKNHLRWQALCTFEDIKAGQQHVPAQSTHLVQWWQFRWVKSRKRWHRVQRCLTVFILDHQQQEQQKVSDETSMTSNLSIPQLHRGDLHRRSL